MTPPQTPSSADRDLALKRYDTALKLLISDTQIYWTRSHLFLVANAALIAFALNSIPLATDVRTVKILALAIGSITGIVLCTLWRRGLKAGEGWMNHWKAALTNWEESAFGDVNFYRARPTDVPKSSGVARSAALLFLTLWCIIAAYVGLCLYLRAVGCPLP
jgi:hypothetical protein